MADPEKAPLIHRKDFRSLSQPQPDPAVVQCCGVESSRLAKIPVIRTLFRKKDPSEKVSGVASWQDNHMWIL